MTQPKSESDTWSKIIIGVFIPLMVVSMSMLYNYIAKLDERQYQLQGSAITETKLQKTETRIINYVDVRFGDLSQKIDNFSDQQAKTNEILINLMTENKK